MREKTILCPFTEICIITLWTQSFSLLRNYHRSAQKSTIFLGVFSIFSDLAKGVWTFFIYVTENIFGLREEKTLAEFVGNTIASGSRTTSVQFF